MIHESSILTWLRLGWTFNTETANWTDVPSDSILRIFLDSTIITKEASLTIAAHIT